LNGLVAGKPTSAGGKPQIPSTKAKAPAPNVALSGPAAEQHRKRQMEQLASMGVVIPDEYRRDMSLAGEWSTVSERPVYLNKRQDDIKGENEDGDTDGVASSFGVRKRKLDEDEEAAEAAKARNWGSSLKSYPGSRVKTDDEDIDALLTQSAVKKEAIKEDLKDAVGTGMKEEEPAVASGSLSAIPDINDPAPEVKREGAGDAPPVVFKKRKGKR